MTIDVTETVIKHLSALDADLTKQLRKEATNANWPASVVKNLSVKTVKTGITISYPQDIEAEVGDLEYGTMNTPPSPVLRKFVVNNSAVISDTMLESSLNYLEDMGVIP